MIRPGDSSNRHHSSSRYGLKPQTTYYYTVHSMQGNGKSDGVKSKLADFANPQTKPRLVSGRLVDHRVVDGEAYFCTKNSVMERAVTAAAGGFDRPSISITVRNMLWC